jgi:glycolate oxidase FAD binding subunit
MTTVSDSTLVRLEALVAADNFSTDSFSLENYSMDGVAPRAMVAARSVEQTAEILRFCCAENLSVVPVGNGAQLHIGMPPARYDVVLRVMLDEIISYDPGDLTLSVGAGLQVNNLNQRLGEHGQFLPLDSHTGGFDTVGGALAVNAAGPLRQAYGTARDFLLGLEFVTGEGVRTKSGSRVVKSVSGYDIHKLLIGSLGTLGVITSANFRTFPRPPAQATFLIRFRDASSALAFRNAVAASPLQPRAFDILSPDAAAAVMRQDTVAKQNFAIPELPLDDFKRELSEEKMQEYLDLRDEAAKQSARAVQFRIPVPEFSQSEWTALINVGGNERVVERHCRNLEALAAWHGATGFAEAKPIPKPLDKMYLEDCFEWVYARSFPRLANPLVSTAVLLKCSVLPTNFASLLEAVARIAEEHSLARATLLRAAGIVYVMLIPDEGQPPLGLLSGACNAVYAATQNLGGTAVVEACPAALKQHVNVWGNVASGPLALMRALKNEFDPKNILSPGRFVGGL